MTGFLVNYTGSREKASFKMRTFLFSGDKVSVTPCSVTLIVPPESLSVITKIKVLKENICVAEKIQTNNNEISSILQLYTVDLDQIISVRKTENKIRHVSNTNKN